MRHLSATHVRRLLPDLPPVGPAYQSLAASLRALILDGRLPLGTRLPAERELARALGVSRTTTSAAYSLLRGDGYLRSRRGAGSFASFPSDVSVADPSWLGGEAAGDLIDLSVAAPGPLREPSSPPPPTRSSSSRATSPATGTACSACPSCARRWPSTTGAAGSRRASTR